MQPVLDENDYLNKLLIRINNRISQTITPGVYCLARQNGGGGAAERDIISENMTFCSVLMNSVRMPDALLDIYTFMKELDWQH